MTFYLFGFDLIVRPIPIQYFFRLSSQQIHLLSANRDSSDVTWMFNPGVNFTKHLVPSTNVSAQSIWRKRFHAVSPTEMHQTILVQRTWSYNLYAIFSMLTVVRSAWIYWHSGPQESILSSTWHNGQRQKHFEHGRKHAVMFHHHLRCT